MLSLLSSSASLSAELTGSCLLAVAELSSSLGPQLIPLLPPALPPVLQRVGGGGGVMVQISAVTALGVIVQTLPKFLSSYAAEIVEKVGGVKGVIIIFTWSVCGLVCSHIHVYTCIGYTLGS